MAYTPNPIRLRSILTSSSSLRPRPSPSPHLRQCLSLSPSPRPHPRLHARPSSNTTPPRPLPKLAQSTLWTSILPKSLRTRFRRSSPTPTPTSTSPGQPQKPKEWNPASFYIIIFLLIGSQAIRMIALKNEYAGYLRSTEAKIRLLREVIEKVRGGERVDVERLLGTGGEVKEREWDEVLREIEREDSLWHQRQVAEEERRQGQDGGQGEEKKIEEAAEDGRAKRKVSFF